YGQLRVFYARATVWVRRRYRRIAQRPSAGHRLRRRSSRNRCWNGGLHGVQGEGEGDDDDSRQRTVLQAANRAVSYRVSTPRPLRTHPRGHRGHHYSPWGHARPGRSLQPRLLRAPLAEKSHVPPECTIDAWHYPWTPTAGRLRARHLLV